MVGSLGPIGPKPATVTVWEGGHKVQVRLSPARRLRGTARPTVPGRRGAVRRFSPKSRRRLRVMLAGVQTAAPVFFVTLTYPKAQAPDPERLKDDMARFSRRFRREFPLGAYVWVLEHTKAGTAHVHLLTWGAGYARLRAWVPRAWYEAARTGNPAHLQAGTRVERPRRGQGLNCYLSKYSSKGRVVDAADGQTWGRWWGVVGRPFVPWAGAVVHDVTRRVAVQLMRWQRRAGTVVTAHARARAGWSRGRWGSKARWRIPGRAYPSLTRVGPPARWGLALALAIANEGGFDLAPDASFGAWVTADGGRG